MVFHTQFNTKIISFEGIDGSGKSTVIKNVATELQLLGKKVHILTEPGTTEIGLALRKLIKSDIKRADLTELFLFEASRADMVQNYIVPLIDSADFILIDRYIDSTRAYQGYGKGLSQQIIQQLNTIAVGHYQPDKTIYIDVSLETAALRRKKRDGDIDTFDKDPEFAQRVYDGYQELIKEGHMTCIYNHDFNECVNACVRECLRAR